MKKFTAKFLREFEVVIEADDSATGYQIAEQILAQFPKGSVKLLSVIAEDHEDNTCKACQLDWIDVPTPPRGGKPTGGGSPQTPALPVSAPLVDQIAEAA
jgi:hypothetical protein